MYLPIPTTESRFLDVVQNINLPFNGFIHLVGGCFQEILLHHVFIFYISDMT